MRWIVVSQSIAILGSSLVFPFYLIFIKEVSGGFLQYGISYGLFTISSSLVHIIVGKWSDRLGRKLFLLISSWGMAILLLFFPLVTDIWQVYALQIILGIIGATQKTSEKAMLADFTEHGKRGIAIGKYHFWTSIFTGIAVMLGGFIIDLFTLDIIFYISSIILFISGFFVLKIVETEN
ncbi:MFS transporter [Lederbergia wuyishanensis]|uniref:MFS family permease n=1 Tax=Lederbergia wuyishanensis TaxID=1347903 RepID=A0ABU0D7F2_9BACI|nr:MFS transporter [Lederbergia wuyishanensis]MCJ8009002.1 MFS transporter [Lederbergia wuyishanensis]MDQ0344334.1 MFS family permease [Lederbergia wuyishanensis]